LWLLCLEIQGNSHFEAGVLMGFRFFYTLWYNKFAQPWL
jgi:hypothetical protein